MEPASAERLLKAFQILDTDGKGTLSKEYMGKLMSEEGEPFTQVSSHWGKRNVHFYENYLFGIVSTFFRKCHIHSVLICVPFIRNF